MRRIAGRLGAGGPCLCAAGPFGASWWPPALVRLAAKELEHLALRPRRGLVMVGGKMSPGVVTVGDIMGAMLPGLGDICHQTSPWGGLGKYERLGVGGELGEGMRGRVSSEPGQGYLRGYCVVDVGVKQSSDGRFRCRMLWLW